MHFPALPGRSLRRLTLGVCSALLLTSVAQVAPADGETGGTITPATTSPGADELPVGPVPELATRTSSTIRNADGTLTSEIAEGPLNYLEDGSWQPIDNTLVDAEGSTYGLTNAANSYEVLLPEDPSADAVMFTVDNAWVKMRMLGLGDDEPEASGSEATLSEVRAADEVTYEATDSGLKETIVLDAPPAGAVTYTYNLTVSPGLTPRLDAAGAIQFETAAGVSPISIPASNMFDSAAPEPAYSTAVAYGLTGSGSQYQLRVTPSASWLSDPARVYPVSIDPSLDTFPPKDCWMQESTPNTSRCNNNFIWAGIVDNYRRRGLLDFRIDSIPAYATLQSSLVYLYMDSTNTVGNGGAADFGLWQPGQDWSQAATWNNSGTGAGWGAGDIQGLRSDLVSINGGTSGWKAWDVANFVNYWRAGTLPNRGMVLAQNGEGIKKGLAFVGQAQNNGWKPILRITYTIDNPPNAPSTPTIDLRRSAGYSPTTPAIFTSASDPENSSVRIHWYVVDVTQWAPKTVWNDFSGYKPSGSSFGVQVPTKTLIGGHLYYAQAYALDTADHATASAVTYFRAADAAPSLPNLSINPCSTCSPEWFITGTTTPTFSASATDSDSNWLTYDFEVRDYESESTVARGSVSGAPGATVSWTAPSLPLTGMYEFGVKVTDGNTTIENAWYAMSISVPQSPNPARELSLTPCLSDCASLTTRSTQPTLIAQLDDESRNALTSKFSIYTHANTNGNPLASGAGTAPASNGGTSRFTVPASVLAPGKTYYFKVTTKTSSGNSISDPVAFDVMPASTPAPSAPTMAPCEGDCTSPIVTSATPTFTSTNPDSSGSGFDMMYEVKAGTFVLSGQVINAPARQPVSWTVGVGQLSNGPAEVRVGTRNYSGGVAGTEVNWNGWAPLYINAPVEGVTPFPAESAAAWSDDEPNGTTSSRGSVVDEGPSAEASQFSENSMARTAEISDGLEARSGGTDPGLSNAKAYSPILRFDSGEQYFPLYATTFVNNSKLGFNHYCGAHTIDNNPAASKLAAYDGYPHHLRTTLGRCAPNHLSSYAHTTEQGAAPFADGGPPFAEGYYLDLPDDLRDGAHNGDENFSGKEPFYYRYVPNRYVTYAFLYGDSAVAFPLEERVSHEGDWEFVWVWLDKRSNQAKAVQYEIHGKSCLYPISAAPLSGTHPVVDVGQHSHASYPAGNGTGWRLDDHADGQGRVWAGVNLKSVTDEPWFGYAGAWGQPGGQEVTSGPEGIDPYKYKPLPNPSSC